MQQDIFVFDDSLINNMKSIIAIFLITLATNTVANEKVYKGIYVWGPEVHSFTPCDKNHNYWVSFDWAGFEMLEHYKSSKKRALYAYVY